MFRLNAAAHLSAALLVTAALASTAARAGTNPDGLSFAVKVTPNTGAPFSDCFSFGADGRLVIAGLRRFGALAYADKSYGSDVSWLAVAPPRFVARFGAGYMFAGQVQNGNLVATGLSTPAFTYSITGSPTARCPAAPASVSSHWTAGR